MNTVTPHKEKNPKDTQLGNPIIPYYFATLSPSEGIISDVPHGTVLTTAIAQTEPSTNPI